MADAAFAPSALPDALRLGLAELAVSDIERSIAFYEAVVGLRTLDRASGVATLGGTGGSAVLRLVETPGARPKPKEAPGLFHVAILLPERRDLAVVLARLVRNRVRIGASDHLVSEALYLDDPDGNGLEIYRDRPKAEWPYRDGALRMATEPMAAQEVLAELSPGADLDAAMPAGTVVGHVHLQVGDLAAARSFWIDAVGFALTTTYPGALFMSAGGYHHHVAANVWSSRGRGPAPEGSVGLRSFEAILPDANALDAVAARLGARGVPSLRAERGLTATDPWGSTIVFVAP
ncbi:catechol 2,3-dioxygenase [Methylopila capsulata]|uniref:Catechol 2,3-dioxygenase n=1 Tax=Methylopila capsulata TaxID=61654 RepID=A0A9W6MQU8_9HYPH|nr:VOC family protein [Methylopila capsulata]MBM7851331.1 catechol 2,3-dioxygenase [Methylopila capsulata]GLK54389.1 catechol-2,3-dioxygenase [Methylopila capsulata]